MELDIILPNYSFSVHAKGPRNQLKGSRTRMVVQSIVPCPDENHAVYFDPVKTQITLTETSFNQRQSKATPSLLQLNSQGIGGLSGQILTINKALFFLTHAASVLSDQHLLGPTSFLIHGPEGTGKTLLLERIAECPWQHVYRVNPELHPKGQAKAVSEAVEDALGTQPSLILMDNLDKFLEKAESLATRLRTELAKLEGSQVVVAAAARSVLDIDISLRTTAAFKTELEIFPPNTIQREDIIRTILGSSRKLSNVNFSMLAERSHGFVGRDIHKLCGLARNQRVQQIYESLAETEKPGFVEALEASDFITQDDFDAVIDQVQPTVLKDSILEVPKVRWADIAGLDHVRALLEAITIRPFKVS